MLSSMAHSISQKRTHFSISSALETELKIETELIPGSRVVANFPLLSRSVTRALGEGGGGVTFWRSLFIFGERPLPSGGGGLARYLTQDDKFPLFFERKT